MLAWAIEKIVHFERDDLTRDGLAHFSFHDKSGRLYAVFHDRHFFGLVAPGGDLEWTAGPEAFVHGVPNIQVDLNFPMFVDSFCDGTLLVSNFMTARLYRIDSAAMQTELFVDGRALGMADAGNCVIDTEDCVWVNEVTGSRVRRFDCRGRLLLSLGDGTPGFEDGPFDKVRFNWIYDLRLGPEGKIYVLDSRNFAVRMIDISCRQVRTVAGTGRPGYTGDGGPARAAAFGGAPKARFDGPISLSVDEEGNIFVGDRWNHVVRTVESATGVISTTLGKQPCLEATRNDPMEKDPFRINLPKISSMDYHSGRLFVPTGIDADSGDLIVLRKRV